MRNILISLLTCAALTGGSGLLSDSAGASQASRQSVLESIRLGQISIDVGAADRALAAFQTAVTVDPSQPLAWFGLAQAHRQAGDEPSALAAIREAKRRIAGATSEQRSGILAFERQGGREAIVAMR
jgi:predicted Zn-dependent protease